jgi:hypothetical protein
VNLTCLKLDFEIADTCAKNLACREETEEEDQVERAENDFWASIKQDKLDFDAKERKRVEATQQKNQPTPIPEEGGDQTAENQAS